MVSSSAACCARAGVSAKREAAAIKRTRTVATPQNSLFLRLPHTDVLDFIGRSAASQVATQAVHCLIFCGNFTGRRRRGPNELEMDTEPRSSNVGIATYR
jgi:hypothetical protein